MSRGPEDHIGDGVYVEYTGYSIILRANDHLNPTDTIELDMAVFAALNRFVNHHHNPANEIPESPEGI